MPKKKSKTDPLYADLVDQYMEYDSAEMETITTYAAAQMYKDAFADGKINFLVVAGPPSTGKSQMFSHSDKAHWFHKGRITVRRLYEQLYQHMDELVILDDVRGIISDPQSLELLKALCDTDPVKTISWEISGELPEDIPKTFKTKSKCCIIVNSVGEIDAHLSAVLDRADVIRFLPTVEELHKYVGTWFKQKQVYEYIGERLMRVRRPSCRMYVKAAEKLKAWGWEKCKQYIDLHLIPENVIELVRKLEVNTQFPTREAKAANFIHVTTSWGKPLSAPTYYRLREKHLAATEKISTPKTGRKRRTHES